MTRRIPTVKMIPSSEISASLEQRLSRGALRDDTEIGMSATSSNRRLALKTIASGILWMLGAAWMVLGEQTPIDDFRLMLHARAIQGEIFDTWQDVEEGDDGSDNWTSAIAYRFRLSDGRELTGVSRGRNPLRADLVTLERPVPAQVEYHPDDPSLNRLSGDGSHTLLGWLRHTAAFLIIPGFIFLPGILLLKNGLISFLRVQRDPLRVALERTNNEVVDAVRGFNES